MTDADRALAPLDDARAAISRLDTYEKPQELAEALEAIGQAVERSLRQLLRLDPSQPDEIRLHAQDAQQLPFERVIALLRQQERISLALANEVHALRQADERARAGRVQAADADQALQLISDLRAEIAGRAPGVPRARPAAAAPSELPLEPPRDHAVRAAAHGAVERGEFDAPAHAVPPAASHSPRGPRRVGRGWLREEQRGASAVRRLLLGAALVLALVALGYIAYRAVDRWSAPSELEQGVSALREGRLEVAERHFRAALHERESATAELYLGRVLRRQGRYDDAGAVLNAARKRYPNDADLLRELGYLLAVDLKRPAAAVAPLRRAVELEPDQDANWIALIRALRASGDTAAEQWFARAPASAQAALRLPPN